MVIKTLTREEKYYFIEQKLHEGLELEDIAKMSQINMKMSSLYSLRSDVRKVLKTNGNPGQNCKTIINHISLENLKDHLVTSEDDEAKYILNLFTTTKKPLQSNGIKIIKYIREMLLKEFYP